jgi:hypothetical protein
MELPLLADVDSAYAAKQGLFHAGHNHAFSTMEVFQ